TGPRPRQADADRTDEFEMLDAAARTLGAALEMLERLVDDAVVEAHQQQHAVGDLARELDRLRTRGGHHDRDPAPGRIAEPSGCAVEVRRLAGEQSEHRANARALLRKRHGPATERDG